MKKYHERKNPEKLIDDNFLDYGFLWFFSGLYFSRFFSAKLRVTKFVYICAIYSRLLLSNFECRNEKCLLKLNYDWFLDNILT